MEKIVSFSKATKFIKLTWMGVAIGTVLIIILSLLISLKIGLIVGGLISVTSTLVFYIFAKYLPTWRAYANVPQPFGNSAWICFFATIISGLLSNDLPKNPFVLGFLIATICYTTIKSFEPEYR